MIEACDYGLTVATAPAGEPVSLAKAKAWLRMDPDLTADDALIADLLAALRETLEREFDRTFVTTGWLLTMTSFPTWEVRLPRGPVTAVESVEYLDAAGDLQTLDPGAYELDAAADPAVLQPVYNGTWPACRQTRQAVRITYTAGHAAAAVPKRMRLALLVALAWNYERRGDGEGPSIDLPPATRSLMRSVWNGASL
jgi:uncharacterized phiE125 gp8 family phage protein